VELGALEISVLMNGIFVEVFIILAFDVLDACLLISESAPSNDGAFFRILRIDASITVSTGLGQKKCIPFRKAFASSSLLAQEDIPIIINSLFRNSGAFLSSGVSVSEI
jgi:hypothetical protein